MKDQLGERGRERKRPLTSSRPTGEKLTAFAATGHQTKQKRPAAEVSEMQITAARGPIPPPSTHPSQVQGKTVMPSSDKIEAQIEVASRQRHRGEFLKEMEPKWNERLAAATAKRVEATRKELDAEFHKILNAQLQQAYNRGRADSQGLLTAAVAQTEAETIKKLGDKELQRRLKNAIANIKAARDEGKLVSFNKYMRNKDDKILQDRANFQRILGGKDQEIQAKQPELQRFQCRRNDLQRANRIEAPLQRR